MGRVKFVLAALLLTSPFTDVTGQDLGPDASVLEDDCSNSDGSVTSCGLSLLQRGAHIEAVGRVSADVQLLTNDALFSELRRRLHAGQLSTEDVNQMIASSGDPEGSASSSSIVGSASSSSVVGSGSSSSAEGGHMHHSVFAMHMTDLDTPTFWEIFTGMIIFTVIIDRAQALADHLAKDSEDHRMFLERVYAELMMFGIVAISIFIYSNVSSISEHTHTLFEFVDILCSMGACSLIGIAACFFVMETFYSRRWEAMENSTDNDDATSHYKNMREAFIQKAQLSSDFVFNRYLERQLVKHALEVMSVRWTTWLAFLVVPAIGLFHREYVHQNAMSNTGCLELMACLNFMTFIGHLCLLWWLRWARQKLDESLEDGDHAHQTKEVMRSTQPVTESSISRHTQLLQLLALSNAFLIAVFLMTELYNAGATRKPMEWLVLEGTTLFLNTVVLLPQILVKLSVVDGFFVPCGQVIGAVLELNSRVDADVRELRQHWIKQGRKMPEMTQDGDAEAVMDEEQFSDLLHDLRLHVSQARQQRLFTSLDADNSGTIGMKEIMDTLNSEDKKK